MTEEEAKRYADEKYHAQRIIDALPRDAHVHASVFLVQSMLDELSRLHHRLAQSEKAVAFWQEKAQRVKSDEDADLEHRKQIRLDRILRLMPPPPTGLPLDACIARTEVILRAAEESVEKWARDNK